jgi:endonuclease YncB( thermonuclease family)
LDGADLTGARLIFAGLPVNLHGASVAGAKIDPANRKYVNDPATVTPALTRTIRNGALLPSKARTGYMLQAYDGQTAEIYPIGWVRLIGLTIPNLSDPYGQTAHHYFFNIFGRSHVVKFLLGRFPREPRPGNTGRWLIYAWNSHGTFVNGELLRQGLAVRRADAMEGASYVAQMNAAALYARATGKALWTICPVFPP